MSGLDPMRAALAGFDTLDPSARRTIVVAVSGGSDSIALMLAAHAWAKPRGIRLLAVTVDHGLRPEARREAEFAAGIASGLSIPHRILRWDGAKPSAGLAAAAREARYRLLDRAAADAGTDLVLVGHTMDDQAETVAMRLARPGRGWGRGDAGMAPATLVLGRSWIARPLLGVRREALRDMLAETGTGWIEDPTNEDPRWERVRVRGALSRSGDVETLARRAGLAANARMEQAARAATLVERHAQTVAPGLIAVARALVADPDEPAALLALATLIAVLGGAEHLAERAQVLAVREDLLAGAPKATLGGAVIENRKGTLFIRRELRGLPEPEALEPGVVWDGRYVVSGEQASTVRTVGVLAARGRLSGGQAPTGATARMAAEALAAEPDGGQALRRVAGPWALFLPSFDLDLARAVNEMLGLARPPAPPLVKDGRMTRPDALGKLSPAPYFSHHKASQA